MSLILQPQRITESDSTPVIAINTRRERLRFADFTFTRAQSGQCSVEVSLEWDGHLHVGRSIGQSSPLGDFRVAAEATLRALEDFAKDEMHFELLGVRHVRAFDANLLNVAVLFAADPEIPSLLKQLVLMCGVYTGRAGQGPGISEWNALVDPVATALVYHHGAGKLLGVGLDVTTLCNLPSDTCRQRFTTAGGALGVVGQMAEVWFKHSGHITFHDPLAATLLFAPELCTYATGTAHVFTEAGPLAGLTRWQEGGVEPHPHTVARTVNTDGFFSHYFGITGG